MNRQNMTQIHSQESWKDLFHNHYHFIYQHIRKVGSFRPLNCQGDPRKVHRVVYSSLHLCTAAINTCVCGMFRCPQEEPGCICRCRACSPCWPTQHSHRPSGTRQNTAHASPENKYDK